MTHRNKTNSQPNRRNHRRRNILYTELLAVARYDNHRPRPLKIRAIFLAALTSLALAGCTIVPAINKDNNLPNDQSKAIFIDAQQRAVLTAPREVTTFLEYDADGKPSKTETIGGLAVCAEAAPDVFSTIASSASGSLSADVAGKSGEAQAAFALSQNAATIARTQTINMLRESMYRTCERYLNGGIDKDELVVQAARDQRAMVSILAIEQLTGVFTPLQTALTNSTSAATQGPSAEIIKLLSEAQTAKEKAKNTHDKAQEDVKAAEKARDDALGDAAVKESTCETLPDDISGKPAAEKTKYETAKTKCADLKQKQAAAADVKEKADEAEAYYKTVKKLADAGAGLSAGNIGAVKTTPAQTQAILSQNIGAVAQAVSDIVNATFSFDELEMTCVVALRRHADNPSSSNEFINRCFNLLAASTESDIRTAQAVAQRSLSLHERNIDRVMACVIKQGRSAAKIKAQINAIADAAINAQPDAATKASVRGSAFIATIRALDNFSDISADLRGRGPTQSGVLRQGAEAVCP